MPDAPEETLDAPSAMSRFKRLRRSIWPTVVAATLLVILVVGTIYSLLTYEPPDEPWRINYPKLRVLYGSDYMKEGKRYLRMAVRFDKEILTDQDAQFYLGALLEATRDVYDYYHIGIQNAQGVLVLNCVLENGGLYNIARTPAYYRQGGGSAEAPSPILIPVDLEPDDDHVKQPWEFDYPALTWLSGKHAQTDQGTPFLRVRVRFEKHVLEIADLNRFLDAAVTQWGKTSDKYHVKAFNARKVHVLDAVMEPDGRRRVYPTENYAYQEVPDDVGPQPEIIPD